MIRLLVTLVVAVVVLYVVFFRQVDDTGRSEELYESQLRQAQEVKAELQQQLEQRMKQIDEATWQGSGIGVEKHGDPRPPPWHGEEQMGPPLPEEEN